MELQKELTSLFDSNPGLEKCKGCSFLQTTGKHCILDYEDATKSRIMFVSDYLKMHEGDYVPFRANEYNLIMRTVRSTGCNILPSFIASVKCPLSKADDLPKKDRKICRAHLIDSIETLKPEIVFACGSLPISMFFNKDKDFDGARGQATKMSLKLDGHTFLLVPIFHPYQVIAEPKNSFLFSTDIKLNIEKHILGVTRKSDYEYIPVFSLKELQEHWDDFTTTSEHVTNDIETTGLDFLNDVINTTSFTLWDSKTGNPKKTIVIPVDHIAAKVSPTFKSAILEFAKEVFSNPKNKKSGQNFKFDMRFWMRYGVTDFKNIWDTKLMQHMISEEIPKSQIGRAHV